MAEQGGGGSPARSKACILSTVSSLTSGFINNLIYK